MLRCLKVLLTAALVLTAVTPALAVSTWRLEECRMNTGSPAWTTWNVKQMIRCATTKWSVPGGATKAIQVASCESGPDLLDHSTDGYAGTFQQAVEYWPERHRNTERVIHWELQRSVFNPRPNVIVSIRMAHNLGWSPTWDCA